MQLGGELVFCLEAVGSHRRVLSTGRNISGEDEAIS